MAKDSAKKYPPLQKGDHWVTIHGKPVLLRDAYKGISSEVNALMRRYGERGMSNAEALHMVMAEKKLSQRDREFIVEHHKNFVSEGHQQFHDMNTLAGQRQMANELLRKHKDAARSATSAATRAQHEQLARQYEQVHDRVSQSKKAQEVDDLMRAVQAQMASYVEQARRAKTAVDALRFRRKVEKSREEYNRLWLRKQNRDY